MKMKIIFSIAVFFAWGSSPAQNIQIDRIDVRGNKIIVRYTLNDDNPKNKYSINLYSSADKFSKPLTKVTDDVGPDVRPGTNKKITWSLASEIGDYKGSISLEIRGTIAEAFLQISESNILKSYKRGKGYPIQWVSGNPSGQVNIELYRGKELKWKTSNVPNSGRYNWQIPATVKRGKGYQLKFVNANDKEESVFTKNFAIKRKTPLILKVGAVALAGVGVAVIRGGSKSSGDTTGGTKLPDPPAAPGG